MHAHLHKYTYNLGLTGLYIFALFGWLGRAGANIGMAIMLLAIIFQYRQVWNVLRHSPLTYLFFAFSSYICFSAIYAESILPNTENSQWSAVGQWLRIWLFIIVAWWLNGNTNRIHGILLLAFLGFLLKVGIEFDWTHWKNLLEGGRLSFGLNLNATTLISGIGLIGLVVFANRITSFKTGTLIYKTFRISAWLLLLFIFVRLIIVTQSRAVWVGLAFSFSVLMVIVLTELNKSSSRKEFSIVAGLFILLSTIVFYVNYDTISNRFSKEQHTFSVLTDDWAIDALPYTSGGARIHMLHFGTNRWLEKPLFGWGPGTMVTRDLYDHDYKNELENNEVTELYRFPHLHNAYLITLVRLGSIGAILIFAAFLAFNHEIRREYKKGIMDRQVLLFYIGSLLTLLISNLAMFRAFTDEDRTLLYLVFGTAYSYRLASLKRQYA